MKKGRFPIRIGTRGSALALWQAKCVAQNLGCPHVIKIIKTKGDHIKNSSFKDTDSIGIFTKEIQDSLLLDHIDIAVHSLKDMPSKSDPRLSVFAYIERGSPHDVLLVKSNCYDPHNTIPLKDNSIVGTSSVRRQALLRHFAPNCISKTIRGNVPTRLSKCIMGDYSAIILAEAGLNRLDINTRDLIRISLNPHCWLPAPGQGIIAVECRSEDTAVIDIVTSLNHEKTEQVAEIERGLLSLFGGGCHTSFAAYASLTDKGWHICIGTEFPELGWRIRSFNERPPLNESLQLQNSNYYMIPVWPEELWTNRDT